MQAAHPECRKHMQPGSKTELGLEEMQYPLHTPQGATRSPDMARLMDACRSLIAERGLRKLSLRTAAKVSGWTLGEIGYRIGSKPQLIACLVEYERAKAKEVEHRWHTRLGGVDQLSSDLLATIITEYIDEISIYHRGSTIFWHEILIEAGVDESLRPLITPWIEEREAFWRTLLTNRYPGWEVMAPLIASYISGEKIYSVTLAKEPSYRLIRMACIKRLCDRTGHDPSGAWNGLFVAFDRLAPPESPSSAFSRQAEAVARAAGRLILDQGVSAVTHRAVALALEQTPSAVSHHFKTGVDLISAGFQLLYEDIERELKSVRLATIAAGAPSPPESMRRSTASGVIFVRAMHMIALASVRDESFLPLTLRERAVRGRMIAAWFGENAVNPAQLDRIALQVISMSMGGRTLHAIARGDPSAGSSTADLFAIFEN